MVNKQGYVGIWFDCANICRALERGMSGKKLDDLSQSVWGNKAADSVS